MRVSVSSVPATEPVTTAEAKTHLNIDVSDHDTYIGTLVTAARKWVEGKIGRKLVTQTLISTYDQREFILPLTLPYGPVQSISSVQVYDDENDEWDTVASTAYYQAGDVLAEAEDTAATTWPTADRTRDSFRVTYVAGYGAAAAVPEEIKQAIFLLVGAMFEDRLPYVTGTTLNKLPLGWDELLYGAINYAL